MTSKLAYLDSLRGLAAIVVVLAHAIGAFYPHAIFGAPYVSTSAAELWLRVPPLSLALAGHAAVCLFFILSGYVLSLNFLTAPGRPGQLAEAMLRRPVRLGGLVTFTVLLGYVLMSSKGLVPPADAGGAATPWLARFWREVPTLPQFMFDLCLRPFAAGETYNPPLWTIHKELVGSYLVFGYLALSRKLSMRSRWLLLGVLGVLTFRSLYAGFVLGIAFALAQSQAVARRRPLAGLSWPLLIAGLWLSSQLHYVHLEAAGAFFANPILKLAADFGTGGCAMLGALLVFAAVHLDERLQRMLESRVLRFFGKISFAMYALHFLVLGSLTWHAYRHLAPSLGHDLAAAVASLLSFGILIVLSQAATRWIDQPSMRLAAAMAKRCLRGYTALVPRFAPQPNEIARAPQAINLFEDRDAA